MKLSTTLLTGFVAVTMLAVLGAKPLGSLEAASLEAASQNPAPIDEVVQPESVSIEPFHPPAVTIGDAGHYTPPDFTNFTDVKARKRAFYDYLLPKIYQANEEVVKEREWLIELAHFLVDGGELAVSQREELARIEKRYAVRRPAKRDEARIGELLLRVDVVPASLVLAQAAKESGWGTSRFAREGNNFFGIWCFYTGCGLTPLNRTPGLKHEVAMFDSVADGVRYYIRTINTHVAYEDLRRMRADARRVSDRVPPGDQLAEGLLRYSERGLAYVQEIQSMIRYNQLQRFTRV